MPAGMLWLSICSSLPGEVNRIGGFRLMGLALGVINLQ